MGFTLLEMLVVLTIIAILATLAVPGYLQPVERVRSTQAGACLLEIAGRLERHRAHRGTYAGFAPMESGASCIESLSQAYVFEAGVPDEADWVAMTADPIAWQLRARRRTDTSPPVSAASTCMALVYRDNGQRGVMMLSSGPVLTDPASIRACWR
ncbi:type IV pilin protein [Spiribacter sp. 221]|uniref:type IV pilin protein n=1 Tax=Spiribacter onubensis TaxID=3122420 RepID=UPI00349F43CA